MPDDIVIHFIDMAHEVISCFSVQQNRVVACLTQTQRPQFQLNTAKWPGYFRPGGFQRYFQNSGFATVHADFPLEELVAVVGHYHRMRAEWEIEAPTPWTHRVPVDKGVGLLWFDGHLQHCLFLSRHRSCQQERSPHRANNPVSSLVHEIEPPRRAFEQWTESLFPRSFPLVRSQSVQFAI